MVFRIYPDENGRHIVECCQCGEKMLLRPTTGLDLEVHDCLLAEVIKEN